MNKADDNLASIQTSLTTMSISVNSISQSLGDSESMISQSQASMENLSPMLTSIQNNAAPVVNKVAWVLTLFLVWLLVIQIVIFRQGWELYPGTAGRMEAGEPDLPASRSAE